MKKLGVLPELTKKYILERITQEDIMEFYTGVPVTDYTLIGSSFTSPFREDENPTCNYWYSTSTRTGEVRLRLKDWRGDFNGDIFDVASHRTKISAKTPQGFKLLLHKIARDFNIHKYTESQERDKLDITVIEYKRQAELVTFKVQPRAWNRFDKAYWYDKFGIGSELLKLAKCIPVQELNILGKDGYFHSIYKYHSKDPAYAYYQGQSNGINLWKIYFPLNKNRRKFMTNSFLLQGKDFFIPSRVGLITKSLKDVLVLRNYGISAIAVPAETYLMTKDEYFDFKSKCDVIITNFDYDPAGIRLAQKYKKVHGCQPLMFTRGRYGTTDYGVKDFSEFRELYGHEKTQLLIQTILNQYIEGLDEITKYNYKSLQWINQ